MPEVKLLSSVTVVGANASQNEAIYSDCVAALIESELPDDLNELIDGNGVENVPISEEASFGYQHVTGNRENPVQEKIVGEENTPPYLPVMSSIVLSSDEEEIVEPIKLIKCGSSYATTTGVRTRGGRVQRKTNRKPSGNDCPILKGHLTRQKVELAVDNEPNLLEEDCIPPSTQISEAPSTSQISEAPSRSSELPSTSWSLEAPRIPTQKPESWIQTMAGVRSFKLEKLEVRRQIEHNAAEIGIIHKQRTGIHSRIEQLTRELRELYAEDAEKEKAAVKVAQRQDQLIGYNEQMQEYWQEVLFVMNE